ncbi:hypothetical protein Clacol_001247 [Clathrus columnatus]|uniref:MFS general substrate transporter n=1 Tax=Clathrus columnatus TaxID=1419009 RepID=A0AAV5A344_9AGAM|nr:hypothetical protein Clacol_001247 [Clathrus columnatus]
MSVLVGRWIEIYGVKRVTIIGSVVFSGSLVAAGFCRSIPSLIITQGFLSGIGAGILYIPSVTAPLAWFSKKRSLVLGISSAGSGIGGICYSFLTRLVITKLSYQWALWITACISAFLNLVAIILIKSRSTRTHVNRGSFRDVFKLLKDPRFFVPFFYVPTYAQTQLRATPLTGSILVAVLDLGVSMGKILIGRLADSWIGTMNAIGISMAISGLCQLFLWLPASNSLGLLYVFSFVYGFFGGSIGLLPAILSRIYDAERIPSITGLFYSGELPGEMAGGPIAGIIFSKGNGNWSPVIIYSAMTMFFGSILILATRFQACRGEARVIEEDFARVLSEYISWTNVSHVTEIGNRLEVLAIIRAV